MARNHVKQNRAPQASSIKRYATRCAAAAIAALCLAGCGSSRSLPAEQLPRAADGTVARVGPQKIDQAAYDHLLAAEAELAGSPIPVPPQFELCIKQLRATAKQIGIKTPPSSILLPKCRERYEGLQAKTLDRLLVGNWVIGAAKELGLSVSDAQVQAKLAESKRERFSDATQFKSWQTKTGTTTGELEADAKVELLIAMIQRAVLEKLGPLTRPKLKAYYEAHPEIGEVRPTWDLEIASSDSFAQVARMRREIVSGRSFDEVTAGLTHQPVESKNGHVTAYGSLGRYNEPELDEAIVAAKLHKLVGPLRVMFGQMPHYFVFRVVRSRPQSQKPFGTVEASLAKALPARMQREALSAFTASWAAKWAARTSCATNYTAPLCDRAKAASSPTSLDVFR
jgi:hypothetical protein